MRRWLAVAACLVLCGCGMETAEKTPEVAAPVPAVGAAEDAGIDTAVSAETAPDTVGVSSPEEFRKVLLHHTFPLEPAPETAALVPADEVLDETVFSPVLFAPDSYELDPACRAQLEKIASFLLKRTDVRLMIEGHDDERSGPEYAAALSFQRAGRVRLFLILSGVAPGRLLCVGRGATRPKDPGHSEDAWQTNRRCEFYLVRE